MIRKLKMRKLWACVIAVVLIIAISMNIDYNMSMKSKASSLNSGMLENSKNDSMELDKDSQEQIRKIKDKYNCEETINNIDTLRNKLKLVNNNSEIETEKIIASTKEEVVNEFIISEQMGIKDRMNNIVQELYNSINIYENISDEVNYVAYDNGDYEIEKTLVNEYGTVSKAKIVDEKVVDTKAWHKKKTISGKTENIPYGERSSYFEYQERIALVATIKIGFILNYNASVNGLKATKITDSGTKTTYIGSKLEFQENKKNLSDSTATHEGANIDGTVEAKFTVFPGVSIGDYQFPSGASYSFKINFWLTLSKWNKSVKKMTVKQGMTIYVDDIGIFTQ